MLPPATGVAMWYLAQRLGNYPLIDAVFAVYAALIVERYLVQLSRVRRAEAKQQAEIDTFTAEHMKSIRPNCGDGDSKNI